MNTAGESRRRIPRDQLTAIPMRPPEPAEPWIPPMHRSPRCGARTRHGAPCKAPAVRNRRRCRMHGAAPGTGGQSGNANAWKHGRHTKEARAERKRIAALVGEAEGLLREIEGK